MKTTSSYCHLPEPIWRRLSELIPRREPNPRGGRPRVDLRRVADGIYFVMRTGCPWKSVPPEVGAGSTLHRYFQSWTKCGVFHKLWQQGLLKYEARRGIAWSWQSLDAAMNKAPLGGEKNREKPHGSWQAGRQAVGADRRARRRPGTGDWTGQSTRPQTGDSNSRQRAGAATLRRDADARSICAETKPMMTPTSASASNDDTTCRTSSRAERRLPIRSVILMPRLVAGSMNERNPGSTVSVEY